MRDAAHLKIHCSYKIKSNLYRVPFYISLNGILMYVMFFYVAVHPLLTHILYKILHVLADLHDTRNCNKVFKFTIQHFESRVT
jgi:hypothetical protein